MCLMFTKTPGSSPKRTDATMQEIRWSSTSHAFRSSIVSIAKPDGNARAKEERTQRHVKVSREEFAARLIFSRRIDGWELVLHQLQSAVGVQSKRGDITTVTEGSILRVLWPLGNDGEREAGRAVRSTNEVRHKRPKLYAALVNQVVGDLCCHGSLSRRAWPYRLLVTRGCVCDDASLNIGRVSE